MLLKFYRDIVNVSLGCILLRVRALCVEPTKNEKGEASEKRGESDKRKKKGRSKRKKEREKYERKETNERCVGYVQHTSRSRVKQRTTVVPLSGARRIYYATLTCPFARTCALVGVITKCAHPRRARRSPYSQTALSSRCAATLKTRRLTCAH